MNVGTNYAEPKCHSNYTMSQATFSFFEQIVSWFRENPPQQNILSTIRWFGKRFRARAKHFLCYFATAADEAFHTDTRTSRSTTEDGQQLTRNGY